MARLLCFPHAGGAATAFARLSACLPAYVELLAVQYPGRQERHAEPAAADIATLAEESAQAAGHLGDRPLALLGHSMGSVVAFETARLLERHGSVVRLFASAARAPAQGWGRTGAADRDDRQLVAELRHLGGVPEELLQDQELRREVLRVLRADYRLLGRYRYQPGPPLRAPITVLLGESDPANRAGQVGEWEPHTSGGVSGTVFPGGHFYLNDDPLTVASLLSQHIRQGLENWRAIPGR